MSKIEQLSIENFKAVSHFVADFKGCSAIITAGNDKGKTSFLRGLIDRIRFVRPDIMVKNGAKEGHGEMILDTGEKFLWEFDTEGYDKLTYVSDKGAKKSVSTELGSRFFPKPFDIDKFLQSTPKEQRKQLQAVVKMDFTEIDTRYQKAYDFRHEKNFEAERRHVKLTAMLEVPKVDFVDLTELQAQKEKIRTELNNLYKANKAHNDALRSKWNETCRAIDAEVTAFNKAESDRDAKMRVLVDAIDPFEAAGYPGVPDILSWITKEYPKAQPEKVAAELYPKEPEYITEVPDDASLQTIDKQILEASEINTKAQAYKDYIDYKNQTIAAQAEADEADLAVQTIEAERKQMIIACKFPKGISIDAEGVTIDGLPLRREQVSSSMLYKTALRIGAMNLGEVKTLYFDASYLDKNSLLEIEQWAEGVGLQLLIERPDFDGGEIKYELIEGKQIES